MPTSAAACNFSHVSIQAGHVCMPLISCSQPATSKSHVKLPIPRRLAVAAAMTIMASVLMHFPLQLLSKRQLQEAEKQAYFTGTTVATLCSPSSPVR